MISPVGGAGGASPSNIPQIQLQKPAVESMKELSKTTLFGLRATLRPAQKLERALSKAKVPESVDASTLSPAMVTFSNAAITSVYAQNILESVKNFPSPTSSQEKQLNGIKLIAHQVLATCKALITKKEHQLSWSDLQDAHASMEAGVTNIQALCEKLGM